MQDYPLDSRDSEMSLLLTTMWTNFAKSGDPNTPQPLETSTSWEPRTEQNRQ